MTCAGLDSRILSRFLQAAFSGGGVAVHSEFDTSGKFRNILIENILRPTSPVPGSSISQAMGLGCSGANQMASSLTLTPVR